MKRWLRLVVGIAAVLLLACACGGSGDGTDVAPQTAAPPGARPPGYEHVVVVMEENHSYEQIIGNPDAPSRTISPVVA